MPRRAGLAVLMALVFAAVTALRFLATTGFADDHYVHLSGAQQMQFGEWPSHDFVDLGMPLMLAVSAGARALFGSSLLTEALLVAAAFGLAAALTLKTAAAVSGSILIALGAVALEVAVYPRTYSYPKVLMYVIGSMSMLRYADRPSTGRLVELAAVVVAAFLMRHDHGLYLGAAGGVAVLLVGYREGGRVALRRMAAYAGIGLLLVLPYLLFLQAGRGVVEHVVAGLSLSEVERARTRLPWVGFDFTGGPIAFNAAPWLYYLFYMLPVLALAISWRRPSVLPRERIVPLAVLALLVNAGLLRDSLWVRLPDVIVPAVLLLAALLPVTGAWRAAWARAAARAVAAVVVILTAGSAVVVGSTVERFDRAGLLDRIDLLPRRFADRAAELRDPLSPRQVPSTTAYALLPFFAWAHRCLGPGHFVFTPGFMSEVAVWARRPFAGGQIWYQPGVLSTPADHAIVLERLASQTVPVTIYRAPEYAGLASTFPELDAYVGGRFSEIASFDSPSGELRVLMDTALATRRDEATGWPCYR